MQLKKRLVLTFPSRLVREPITSRLVKDYELLVNIMRAKVNPNEEGMLVIELSGRKKSVDAGLAYLDELGVGVQPLERDITWHEERCTHCTACVPLCPSGALSVDREAMRVSFDEEKCIACEICVRACPYGAMEIHF